MADTTSKECPLMAEDMCSTMCTEICLRFLGSIFPLDLWGVELMALSGNKNLSLSLSLSLCHACYALFSVSLDSVLIM